MCITNSCFSDIVKVKLICNKTMSKGGQYAGTDARAVDL